MGQRTCSFGDCDKPRYSRGLCAVHYRQERAGHLGLRMRDRKSTTPTECTVTDCDHGVLARGLCSMHYKRWRTRGTTEPAPVPPTDLERFSANVNRDGPIPECRPDLGPCWQWTGALNSWGYSAFWHDGATAGAHRAAYKMFVGPIPESYEIDHLCFNIICVNPGHLEAVTRSVNMRRRRRPTHCKNGHPFDETNTRRTKQGWMQCRICRNEYNRIYLRGYRKASP